MKGSFARSCPTRRYDKRVMTLSLALSLPLRSDEAALALDRLLTDTRHGEVSIIDVPGQCLVRMVRRHNSATGRECVLTWEPNGAAQCSFMGLLSLMECGGGRPLTLVLEGATQLRRDADVRDEHRVRERAEASGRAVLERIAAKLGTRSQSFASAS